MGEKKNAKGIIVPRGQTVILHRIRAELGLSCDEYVIADFIFTWRVTQNKKVPSIDLVYRITGISTTEAVQIGNRLEKLGIFDRDKSSKWITTDKWNQYFNMDDDFEEFWKIWLKKGNKKKAGKKYELCSESIFYRPVVIRDYPYMYFVTI